MGNGLLFKHAEGFVNDLWRLFVSFELLRQNRGCAKTTPTGGETKIIWENHLPIDSYFSEG